MIERTIDNLSVWNSGKILQIVIVIAIALLVRELVDNDDNGNVTLKTMNPAHARATVQNNIPEYTFNSTIVLYTNPRN